MKRVIVLLLVVFAFSVTFAQSAVKKLSEYNLDNKIAIQGYDPVAYFRQGKAIKGRKEILALYNGVVYQFSSATNKEIFLKNGGLSCQVIPCLNSDDEWVRGFSQLLK